MSYPQSTSSDAVLKGQTFWRLNTKLGSPGDIYESVSSALGFALGPDSDIANVQVTYLDDLANAAQMNTLTVSTDRSFVGLVNARNDTTYPLSVVPNRPGRILISSLDIYDPSYRPTGFVPADDSIDFQPPILDFVQYFNDPPSLMPQRSDKQFLFKAWVNTGVNWLVLPFYGRKYAYLQIENHDAVAAATWQVLGVSYSITPDPDKHLEKTLQAPVAIAAGAEDDLVIRAATSGVFDAIVIGIDYSALTSFELPLRITISDDPI
jgi:hypothetical protein